jgi:hypothetical protein
VVKIRYVPIIETKAAVALGSQGQSCLCDIAVLAQLLLRERVTKVDGGKTATHATRSAAPEALTLRNNISRRRARKTAFKMSRAAIKRPRGSHARSAQKWYHIYRGSDCDVSFRYPSLFKKSSNFNHLYS